MNELTYREGVARAIGEEMRRDETVVVLGEDIAAAGGVFKTTEGLLAEFGSRRVRDTPISEQAIIGAAIGAAITGLRPVAELMFADFAAVAFDQLANQLPKYRYLTGGQVTLPVTVRLANGAGGGYGAQHSQPVENWLLNVPGLLIAVPATPADLVGLLKWAIRSDDPTLVFEHKRLYNVRGPVPDGDVVIPFGQAAVVREGKDVTVVATQLVRHHAEAAAQRLAEEGIDVELIDPRTLIPLDFDTIAESLGKTGRLLVVQEAPFDGSWASTIVARAAIECLDAMRCEPAVLTAPPVPVPFAKELEDIWVPSTEAIAEAVRALTERAASGPENRLHPSSLPTGR